MPNYRHSDENRVLPGSTPPEVRRRIDWYRERATRRKLILLECGIIRHAPFADCRRPLWDLMAEQPWFEANLHPAEWYRSFRETEQVPEPHGADREWVNLQVNGHRAIRWLEQHADTGDEDLLLLAYRYSCWAEFCAEADRFETPDDRRAELEIRYGAAYWLGSLFTAYGSAEHLSDEELLNTLDHYLGNFSGVFYAWAKSRPLHPGHRPVAVALIEDILGHPSYPERFDAAWRTEEAIALASTMYETRDFAMAPALGDALEEAGCDNEEILAHCRADRLHVRGCWVVDRLMGRS